jgi:two-component system sensor histidine kinase BaeS
VSAARRHRSLAVHIGLVTTAVAFVAVLVATLVSISLVRSAVTRSENNRLARDADLVATFAPRAVRPAIALDRLGARARLASSIQVELISAGGATRGDLAVSSADVSTLLAGHSISGDRSIDGRHLVVQGRPLLGGGAIVLAQPTGLPSDTATEIRHAELLALLAGLLGGAIAGVLLARRVARPLHATAAGALRLAAGDRTVHIEPEGPQEVAEVTTALNALGDALGVSEQREREFLLSVSHELRTPLTAIRGFSESLADGVSTGPDVAPAGRTILAEAERLDRLVSDLLDLARLGAHDFRIEPAEVDLRSVVNAAAEVWRRRCEAEAVELRVELPPGPVPVRTDATRVRQVIDGLAENALRVTPAGRPIVLALQVGPDGARLEVRDGGPGLRAEDLPVAFERSVLYERYRGVRRVGTGLGLALVGALAARLGGSAQAGHAPEGGACFAITLPYDS